MLHNPRKEEEYHSSVVGSDNPVPEEKPKVMINIDTKRFHEVEVKTSGDIRDVEIIYSKTSLRKYFEEVLGDVKDMTKKVFINSSLQMEEYMMQLFFRFLENVKKDPAMIGLKEINYNEEKLNKKNINELCLKVFFLLKQMVDSHNEKGRQALKTYYHKKYGNKFFQM